MAKPLAKSEDPDQMLHSTASDLDLHCSQVTLLGVSRLKWVEENRRLPTCSHLKTLKVDNIALDKWWYQVSIFLLLYKHIWS